MRPIYFDRRFGWLHPAASPARGDGAVPPLGVVLCNPLAQEEINIHHGVMLLAEGLAAAGMPVLRFDYAGTGNSAEGELSLATLLEDIRAAVGCLRQEAGISRVALCGFRLGGALAYLAAREIGDIDALALLAPTLSGKVFLRELRAAASFSSLSLLDPVPARDAELPLNTNGFVWSYAFQQELAGIELAPSPAAAPKILIAGLSRDRKAASFVKDLTAAGAEVAEHEFHDYDAFMRDPTTNEMPDATFGAVTDWLAALSREPGPAAPARPGRRDDALEVRHILAVGPAEEEPLRFGAGERLFGVLCRPRHAAAQPVAVLLLHEGSSHLIGNGGTSVTLARRMAKNGFVSLRIDLTGMGDSAPVEATDSPYYNLKRSSEVSAALDLLGREGCARIVVLGLCAGGYLAFHTGLQDPRIVGMVVVNMQKFIWHDGDDVNIAVKAMKRSVRSYIRSLRNPGEWKRVLVGKADIVGTLRVLAVRSLEQGLQAARSVLPPRAGSPIRKVRDWMQLLSERGVHTHFVYSADDPGLAEMKVHFGRRARLLRNFAPARLTILTEADHHFNSKDARRRFMDMVDAIMADIAGLEGAERRDSAARAGAVIEPAPLPPFERSRVSSEQAG